MKEVPKLNLSDNDEVLDVGCGDGKICSVIAHKYLSNGLMHGIDNSQSMIEKANVIKNRSNVTFECISLFDYAPAKLYDAVVCFWVLYLFDDYHKVLQKVLSFLKPNGKALICHIVEPGTPFFQLFQKKISPQKMPITLPSIEAITLAIRKSLADIHYLEIKKNYDSYSSLNTLIETMKKIPFFKLLPKEKDRGIGCRA